MKVLLKFCFMGLLSAVILAGCGGGGGGDSVSSAKAITAYSLAGVTGTITGTAISVTMPYGSTVTGLVATFTTTGASVKVGATDQVSGTTPNDFTNPVVYTVTAADGTTATYTVTVTVATADAKAITAYSLAGVTGTINETAKTISVIMPSGTTVTALVATFTTTGASVKVGTVAQVSGTTPNDFTSPVTYTVTAFDNTTVTYTVTVEASVIKLPKTGQTTCYDAAGAVIVCTSTGQDGDLQKGVAWPSPRFTVGTSAEADCVTDNLTGLMWVKTPDSITRTWATALTYANDLSLCGYTDWRLPNRKELRSLINYEQANTATWLNTQGFSNVQASYWSSSTYAYYPAYAWAVVMGGGLVDGYDKSNLFYVWPVRAGQ